MPIKIIQGTKNQLGSLFDKVAKLRYKIYLEECFVKKNKKRIFSDKYDENAIHFLALDDDRVVGSLTLIEEKLPLESIYSKEKNDLIMQFKSKRPVELSRFVVEKDYRIGNRKVESYGRFVSLKLFKEAYKYIIFSRIDLILISVNPKYEERYEKRYNFRRYGIQKNYPKANNNPAVLMYQRRKDVYRLLLNNIRTIFFLLKKD